MLRAGLGFVFAFLFSLFIMPLVISLSKKLKLKQTVLHYVDNHAQKSGTPTMGGVGFIISAALACLVFNQRGGNSLLLLCVLVMAGYSAIGFFDDFIKVYFKQNKGLSAWQKIIFQLLIAVIVSIYAFYNGNIGSVFLSPFSLKEIDLGIFSIPINIILFLALTNSVNLIDGLDGLCSKVSMVVFAAFALIIALIFYFFMQGTLLSTEYLNLTLFCTALIGALLGFLCFNGYPAKVFMGDTGSLGIGGGLACLAVVSRLTFLVPIIGIMYVVTALSDILQVLYFKKTKGKRIFKMAPLHHHYERKGIHENRIVTAYTAITTIISALTLTLTFLLNS